MRNQKMINFTESRRVLHIAVRDLNNEIIDDAKINNDVNKVLLRMKEFVEKIHSGWLVGFSGKTFKYYVSIGIGGSDLGPKMTCQALRPFSTGKIECHFVSNIDATNLMQTLDKIDLSRTLFGINSKSFTTVETMRNALAIKKLLHEHFGSSSSEIVSKHFCAMTTNLEETKKFGIANDRVFEFWDVFFQLLLLDIKSLINYLDKLRCRVGIRSVQSCVHSCIFCKIITKLRSRSIFLFLSKFRSFSFQKNFHFKVFKKKKNFFRGTKVMFLR